MASAVVTPQQFAGYVNAVRPALVKFARRQLGGLGNRAEDAVQEAVISALGKLHTFDADTGPAGAARWLYAILRNRIAFEGRAHVREAKLIEHAKAEEAERARECECSEASILRDMELLEDARLRLRVAALTDLQRECFMGRMNDEKASETAKRLGISSEAVRQHVCLAMKKLKTVQVEALTEALVEPDLDMNRWRAWGFSVYTDLRYFPPEKLGTALAREKLRKMQ